MNPRVFREYDFRGDAERDFPDAFVADLGRAIGTFLIEGNARVITLGRDCRLSSPRIHRVLRDAILTAPGVCRLYPSCAAWESKPMRCTAIRTGVTPTITRTPRFPKTSPA